MKAIAICALLLFANAFKCKGATTIAIAIVGRAITIWGDMEILSIRGDLPGMLELIQSDSSGQYSKNHNIISQRG